MSHDSRFRLAVVALHPIPYQVPLWNLLGKHPRVDLTLLYLNDVYVKGLELDYGQTFRYQLIANWSRNPHEGFFRRINPALIVALAKGRYDAVIIHGWDVMSSWIAMLGALLSGTPILMRGEADLHGIRKGWRQSIKRALLPIVLNSCSTVFYSCTGNRQYFEYYKVDPKRLMMLPCAVDNDRLQEEADTERTNREALRTELDIGTNDLVLLMVARLIPLKRPFDLMKVLVKLRDTTPAIKAMVIGDGPLMADIKLYIQEHNLENALMMGFMAFEQVGRYMAIADVGVILSDYDPSPKALNEMLNFGMPIICTDVIGTALDLIQPSKNGYIIPVGDVDKLAEHVIYLNRNRNVLEEMSRQAIETVNQWSFSRDVEAIVAALDQMASNSGR